MKNLIPVLMALLFCLLIEGCKPTEGSYQWCVMRHVDVSFAMRIEHCFKQKKCKATDDERLDAESIRQQLPQCFKESDDADQALKR